MNPDHWTRTKAQVAVGITIAQLSAMAQGVVAQYARSLRDYMDKVSAEHA